MIPLVGGGASELLGLLSSPVGQRRDDWLSDLERRLHDLEGRVDGFRFDDLGNNQQFVSATLHATQAALRTHQAEKLEALQNAIVKVALARAPSDDLQLIFLNLVDAFTPTHLQVLRHFLATDAANIERFRAQRDLTDQVVSDLNDRGAASGHSSLCSAKSGFRRESRGLPLGGHKPGATVFGIHQSPTGAPVTSEMTQVWVATAGGCQEPWFYGSRAKSNPCPSTDSFGTNRGGLA